MSVGNVSSQMVSLDNFFDYVPVFSTATNIVDLFQKCLILPFKDQKSISASHYFTHICQKSFARCFFLLIPVVSNLAIIFFDLSSLRSQINNAPEDGAEQGINLNKDTFYDYHRKAVNKREVRDQRWQSYRDRSKSEDSPLDKSPSLEKGDKFSVGLADEVEKE